jgi:hypothetical protein
LRDYTKSSLSAASQQGERCEGGADGGGRESVQKGGREGEREQGRKGETPLEGVLRHTHTHRERETPLEGVLLFFGHG